MCTPFLLPPLVNVLNSRHVQIQEGLSPNHLKKAKLMFFYTRYPSSNMLKMFFSDVKVSPRLATSLLSSPTVQPLQTLQMLSVLLFFSPQTMYLLCNIITPATQNGSVSFWFSSQGLRGLKKTLFAVCVCVRARRGPIFSPLLSYGFMQKMKEGEVEWVYMRELESL